ncbi:MAG TPA: RIP metalloprotease RseP [Xanthomonadaceae bacterium]|nr:RIP metalloprotease RseP [Xanthomonadaceae bacterium]
MFEFLGSVWWLLVTLGVLVTFHEYGHFWVARRCGVRVLRFSVGFGRPLWKRLGKDGTEYVVAAIPLGGYVRMLDERESDEPLPAEERAQAFNTKPVGQRIAIVAAGPIFNLVFAVFAFWLMFMVGKGAFLPAIGGVEGLAAEAGLKPGDRIVAIADRSVENWGHVSMALVTMAVDRRDVAVDVRDPDQQERRVVLALSRLPATINEERVLDEIGLLPQQALAPAVIGEVVAGSAAARAGIESGDRVVAINDEPVAHWSEMVERVQAFEPAQGSLAFRVERGADRLLLRVTPRRDADGDVWRIGVGQLARDYDVIVRHGPIAAIPAAVGETWRLTQATLGMLWRMVTGTASTRNLSGPITIARYANSSAQLGVAWFLFFLGVVSLSLAILNFLPIPILDGGHLLYYFVELVKGSPVSERTMIAGQYVGLAMLAGLMGLAFYNDIVRLVSS